ncbi:MAG: hypothetical protein WCS16_07545 [Desulfuromonas sp.]
MRGILGYNPSVKKKNATPFALVLARFNNEIPVVVLKRFALQRPAAGIQTLTRHCVADPFMSH